MRKTGFYAANYSFPLDRGADCDFLGVNMFISLLAGHSESTE